jgi:uncharacterized membrane protein HdeD (DUF308 family)
MEEYMKESRVGQAFQGIVGVLFIGFGLLYLLVSQVSLDISGLVLGGIVAVGALIRLIIICLPSSTPFAGSNALEIITGICEALFGIVFVINAVAYMEFIYPLLAGLLVIMAIVRFMQSARIRKSGENGWGSYVFMCIIFLCGAAGLAVVSYVIKIELQNELIGAVAFIYGFFLILSASFKHGMVTAPTLEDGGAQPEEITE